MLPSPHTETVLASVSLSDHDAKLWHRRPADISFKNLINTHEFQDDFPALKAIEDVCRACQLEKAHNLAFTVHLRMAYAV